MKRIYEVILILAGALCFIIFYLSPPASAGPRYTITDLGFRGNADGINEFGQVVGYYQVAPFRYHAYFWDDGIMTALGTLGKPESGARDINELGIVVGGLSGGNGFIWKDNVIKPLPIEPWGINNSGQIVGSSHYGHEVSEIPALWENGDLLDLGTFDENYRKGSAWAINETGQVVGYVENTTNSYQRAFLWQNKRIII